MTDAIDFCVVAKSLAVNNYSGTFGFKKCSPPPTNLWRPLGLKERSNDIEQKGDSYINIVAGFSR